MNETLLLALFILVLFGILYGFVYPQFVKNNMQRLMLFDVLATLLIFVLAAQAYWGSGQRFSFLLFSANWFWATLILTLLLEPIFMVVYDRRWQVLPRVDQD